MLEVPYIINTLNELVYLLVFTHILAKCKDQEAKSPVKNIVRQRCAEGFKFGVKGIKVGTIRSVALWTNIPYTIPGYVYDLHTVLHTQASNGALVIPKPTATEHCRMTARFLCHILQQYDVKKHCPSSPWPLKSRRDLKVSCVSGVPATTYLCSFHPASR
jgi:hypothetical protein